MTQLRHERLRLGIVRLVDSAPAILAESDGLFAAEGLEVDLRVEPSWANIADKLAWDALDAAILPGPLALSMMLGLRGPKRPLRVPMGVNRGGNSIALRSDIAAGCAGDPAAAAHGLAAWLRRQAAPPRFAVVSLFSSHNLLLREWLAGAGIDADRDLTLVVMPPDRVADELAAGGIVGFCAGAPWGERAEELGVGRVVVGTSSIRPAHLEKVLAIAPGLWDSRRAEVGALCRALATAQTACAEVSAGDRVADLLSLHLDLPRAAARRALPGGDGRETVRFDGAAAIQPGDLGWMLEGLRRWGWDAPADMMPEIAPNFSLSG